jgi:hypothetical protein
MAPLVKYILRFEIKSHILDVDGVDRRQLDFARLGPSCSNAFSTTIKLVLFAKILENLEL